MEFWGIEQDLISFMEQLELANVPIDGGTIDPNILGLIDGSYKVVHALPKMEKLSTLL